jgi:hypothetical protein
MTRWSHAHTLAGGALAGFAAATHLWWVALACFALGFVAGNVWHRARVLAVHAAGRASGLVVSVQGALDRAGR